MLLRGNIYLKKEQYKLASEDFTVVLSLNDKSAEAYYGLGQGAFMLRLTHWLATGAASRAHKTCFRRPYWRPSHGILSRSSAILAASMARCCNMISPWG